MFGYIDLFGFFSRYTLNRYSRYDYTPGEDLNSPIGSSHSIPQDGLTNIPGELDKPAPPVGSENQTGDRIELSNPKQNPLPEPVTYSRPLPNNEIDDDLPETNPKNDLDDGNLLTRIYSRTKLDLKMAFSLAEFEAFVAALTEDAKDGQIDTVAYSELNIGLHADLKARAHIKEVYRVTEGEEGSFRTESLKEKTRFDRLEASLLRSRGFEAETFYRESLRTKYKLKQKYHDGFLRVSRKLSMRYKQDFSLRMQALNLYNNQAAILDKTDNLENYINSAETLVDFPQSSGELIGRFFDTVGAYLEGAEDNLIEKIGGFFDRLADEMGIESGMLDSAEEMMIGNITGFFDRVEQAMGSVRDRYITPSEEPEQVAPPEVVDPESYPELTEEIEALA